jgi:tryptophanyl-tRNA synthetase
MPTDPAQVRRTDPGEPERCPMVAAAPGVFGRRHPRVGGQGCQRESAAWTAQPVIDAVIAEQQQFHERAQPYLDDPGLLRNIVADGCDQARKFAIETMREVREVMGLSHG